MANPAALTCVTIYYTCVIMEVYASLYFSPWLALFTMVVVVALNQLTWR